MLSGFLQPCPPTTVQSIMKFYSALKKENSDGGLEDVVVLCDGFSYSAFFFSILWFLYHKMWYESVVIVLVNLVITGLPIFSSFEVVCMQIALSFIVGFNANEWLEAHLKKKKNYKFLGFVGGNDSVDAGIRAFENLHIS